MRVEEASVGRRVRVKRQLSGVPRGTEGVIDEDYGPGFIVAWDLPWRPLPSEWFWDEEDLSKWAAAPGAPLRDGFSKESELHLLEMVG